MPAGTPFDIDDAKSFEGNLQAFVEFLAAHDPALAEVFKAELPKLLSGETNLSGVWDLISAATSDAP